MNVHCFNPGDTVNIGNVTNLKNAFGSLLEEGGRVRLDFSRVEKVDTCGIQLIAAFLKEATERSVQIESVQLSDNLRNAMDRIKLDREIFNESVKGGK